MSVRVNYLVRNPQSGTDFEKVVIGEIIKDDDQFVVIQTRDRLLFTINKQNVQEIREVKT